MHDWRSINESPDAPAVSGPIVLRGIPVTLPLSYRKISGSAKRTGLTAPVLGTLLWQWISTCLSLLAHLLIVLALVGLFFYQPREKETIVTLNLSKGNAGEHGKSLQEPPAQESEESKPVEPEPKKEPDDQKEKPKEEPQKIPKEAPLPPQARPVVAEAEDSPAEEGTPVTLGMAKTAKLVGSGIGNVKTPPVSKEVDGKLIEKDATKAVKARRAGELAKLQRGSDKEIVVVGGSYDRIEIVLDTLGIPYTRMSSSELARYDLSKCRTILVNCHTSLAKNSTSDTAMESMRQQSLALEKKIRDAEKALERARGGNDRARIQTCESTLRSLQQTKRYFDGRSAHYRESQDLVEKLRKFVREGGYLFTSDWGITLVEKAFPRTIRYGGTYGPAHEKIVARRGHEKDSLLQEVFVTPAKGRTTRAMRDLQWEVDSGSYLIRIDASSVITLVEAPKIPRYHAVAVVFSLSPDSGKVLHVLSHFSKQANGYGEYALQNLLLNFLLERMERG